MMPHGRRDVKFDQKNRLVVLNELTELYNCNNVLFFEARKGKDLYMYLARPPNGPTIKVRPASSLFFFCRRGLTDLAPPLPFSSTSIPSRPNPSFSSPAIASRALGPFSPSIPLLSRPRTSGSSVKCSRYNSAFRPARARASPLSITSWALALPTARSGRACTRSRRRRRQNPARTT